MDLGLAGKAAIVNGASQGIGYAIAHLLAEEGARVAVTARRTPALDGAAERIRNETGAEVIVTANPGCLLQMRAGSEIHKTGQQVLHVMELLDRALESVSASATSRR